MTDSKPGAARTRTFGEQGIKLTGCVDAKQLEVLQGLVADDIEALAARIAALEAAQIQGVMEKPYYCLTCARPYSEAPQLHRCATLTHGRLEAPTPVEMPGRAALAERMISDYANSPGTEFDGMSNALAVAESVLLREPSDAEVDVAIHAFNTAKYRGDGVMRAAIAALLKGRVLR